MAPMTLQDVARLALMVFANALWQGALIALVAWAVQSLFPRTNAATRYAVWVLALIAMVTTPIVTTATRVSFVTANAPATAVSAHAPHPAANLPSPSLQGTARRTLPATKSEFAGFERFAGVLPIAALIVWFLATSLILIRLIVAIVALERLKRDALPLGIEQRDAMPQWNAADKGGRDVRLCVSEAIDVPVAIGLFDAMILLPSHLVSSLEPEELDQVALHELGHLLRNDDWTNAVQRVLCSLLFFSPAIWFASRQVDLEREVACDDFVLQLTGATRSYAFCLTKIAEMAAWPGRHVAAPGVFITRRNISIRIERLLRTGRAIGSAIAPGTAMVLAAALLLTGGLMRTMTPSVAYTLVQAPPVAVPAPRKAVAPATHTAAVQHVAVRLPASAHIVEHVAVGHVAVGNVAVGHVAQVAQASPTPRPKRHESGSTCINCDYSGQDLHGRDFSGITLVDADFHRTDLRNAIFDRSRLTAADFAGADLSHASFRGAILVGCDLEGARLTGTVFDGARMIGCDINVRRLSPSQARAFLMSCQGCDLEGADLHGMDLRNAKINGANLSGIDLRGADLSGASFAGVNFEGAKFTGAKLDGARFSACNLEGADLKGVDVSNVTFIHTPLDGTR